MRYEFECETCGLERIVERAVENRNIPLVCTCCNSQMRRLMSTPIVNANLMKDRPENKYALAFDKTEELAIMREDDRRYEARIRRGEETYNAVTKQEFALDPTPKSLAQVMVEQGKNPDAL